MRFVIRERKTLKENTISESKTSWKTTTDPRNFLALAKHDPTGGAEKRSTLYGDFDPTKMRGEIQLTIDPKTGRVESHDGRARALMAIKTEGVDKIPVTININEEKHPPCTWESLPEYFTPEDGRDGYVQKLKFHPKEETSTGGSFDDILGIGSGGRVFNREVIDRRGKPYLKQDPDNQISTLVNIKFSEKFAPALRKSAGMENVAGQLPIPILDAQKKYRDLISSQYLLRDDQGELHIIQASPPHGTAVKLNREPVSDVSISLK